MVRRPLPPIPEKVLPSPDGRLIARLRQAEGASWEPAYAALNLDDLPFGERRFSWHAIWSPCSRYFALAEWRHADEAFGPDAQLVLIDLHRRRESIIDRVEGGFIDPVYIHDGVIKYSFITQAMTSRAVEHRKIEDLFYWRPVSKSLPSS